MRFSSGFLAACVAPIFIAIGVICTKAAGASIHPLLLAALAPLFSVLFLIPLAKVLRQQIRLHGLSTLSKPLLQIIITRSILGNALLLWGITQTTAVKTILLLRLEAVFVLFWQWVLQGKRPRAIELGLLSVLLLGTALVVAPSTGAASSVNLGDALIAVALLLFAYSYHPTGQIANQISPLVLTIVTNITGGLTLLAGAALLLPQTAWVIPWHGAGWLAGYAIAFYVIGLSLFFYAFRTVSAWIIAALLSLEVVAGLLLAVVLLGESMSAQQVVGATVVMVSLLGIAYQHRRGH